MSDVHTRTLISAAAGSGKTVQIVRRYLHELSQGVKAHEIVAITFTRKAAAELVERISRVLRVGAGLEKPKKGDEKLYLSFAPGRDVCLKALAALPSAPVSTVDSFVHGLVSEFLLDAAFECPDGSQAWIDGPLSPSSNDAASFEEAARDALERADDSGKLDADAAVVLSQLSLSAAIGDVALLAERQHLSTTGNDAILEAAGRFGAWMPSDEEFDAIAPKALGSGPTGDAALQSFKDWKGGAAPPAMLPFLTYSYGKTTGRIKTERDEVIRDTIRALGVSMLGEAAIKPDEWKLGAGWHHGDAMKRADDFRAAIWAVSRTARTMALTRMAKSGEADHTELLRVAIHLCTKASVASSGSHLEMLASRYKVLMVDEVQDTNPDQLSFYEAFRAMRADMKALFVGDVRQSIYRFRGGDPHGWSSLIRDTPEAEKGELDTNYRSAHDLVEFQKCLFERLEGYGEKGVDSLKNIDADAKAGARDWDATPLPEPVVVVDLSKEDDPWRVPVAAFARRLGKDWQEAGSEPELAAGAPTTDSAVVLVRSWSMAAKVARELSMYGIQAQVVGDKSLLSSRVATDLRLWLRALLDATDEIAWLGVFKHPSIGLTDAALARIRPFGGLLVPENDAFPAESKLVDIDDADADRLRAVMPVLAEFRRRIGRESTAALLEELVSRFQWRPIIAAGPEELRSVAELDILLDAIRGIEASLVDPEVVISALKPGEGDTDNLAKVRMQQDRPTVEVTTVHSAKGLEYDHVCVLQIEKSGSDGVHGSGNYGHIVGAGIIESAGHQWIAVKIDPAGGLHPKTDPLTGMAKLLGKDDQRKEGFRLLYVALTRASKTITFGVPDRPAVIKIRRALGLAGLPAGKGETPTTEAHPPGVMVLRTDDEAHRGLLERPPLALRTFSQHVDTGALEDLWAADEGRDIRSPSSWSQGKRDGGALKAAYQSKAQLVAGSKPAPKLPLIDHLHITDQGDLVHGWLEAWAFDGEPTKEAALEFLKSHWSSDDAVLAQDLCDIGAHMLAELPAFAQMVRDAKALHFELPLLAEVDGDILTGLADLVVDHEDGTTTVIDFKAGTHFAQQGAEGSIDVPGLSGYCWQLEAYKTALEAAGRTVKETGLVYVRGPSWVRF
jgi:ATP-dependent exoDNAse (exonuclease V) beta subunit